MAKVKQFRLILNYDLWVALRNLAAGEEKPLYAYIMDLLRAAVERNPQ